jgi:hypothetical protein
VSTAALGSRSAAVGDAIELRIRDLERAIGRVASRTLNGSPGYDAKRISATTSGWAVGTWVKLVSGTWTSAATSSTFAADAIGVVLTVIDSTTAEIVTGGFVQLLGTSYTNGALYYLSTSAGTATSSAPAAPNVLVKLFVAYQDGWINVLGPAGLAAPSMTLAGLRDVTLTSPAGGELLKYDAGTSKWINGTLALTALSDVVITAVASNQVLSWDSGTSKWINRTLTSVTTLAGLSDVTITSVADLDLLRYDAGSSKWKNYNLGPMIWVAASRQFALDGGGAASAASVVGIGKADSRFYITSGTGLDFGLSGSVAAGTDINARIRSTGSGDVSFYDQATSTFGSGDKVIAWGCNTTYATRYFRLQMPLQVLDNSGTGSVDLILRSTATQVWDIADDVSGTTKYLSFVGPSGDGASVRRTLLVAPLDLAGKTIYADKGGGSSDNLVFSSSGLTLTSGGAATITLTGASTLDFASGSFTFTRSGGTAVLQIGSTTKVGSAAGTLGFYQGAGSTKQTVSGAKGGNVALANLMTALANLGLLTDSTT